MTWWFHTVESIDKEEEEAEGWRSTGRGLTGAGRDGPATEPEGIIGRRGGSSLACVSGFRRVSVSAQTRGRRTTPYVDPNQPTYTSSQK